jgi:5'-methylthioadenosine phosphorylase
MPGRLGIIGGTAFLEGPQLEGARESRVETARGEVVLFVGDSWVFLSRHGTGIYRPPHRIPHHAHVLAMEELGIDRVVGLNSVGSLTPALGPGTVVVASDYLSAHPPPTFAGDERLHIVPTLDEDLRALLLDAARATEGPVEDGGVYVETRGPRFETPAEVRFLAPHGDVIGMTAASEATLFQERGIGYAMLGMVDNLANGLDVAPLTFEAYRRQVDANEARGRAILAEIIRRTAAGGDS